MLTSTKAIAEEFPNGFNGYREGYSFYALKISKGVLTLYCELLRGNYNHKFRYQNGNFELIGYTEVESNGRGFIYSTDFNLSTGVQLNKKDNYETGKVEESERKILKISPLPKLQDFIPRNGTGY